MYVRDCVERGEGGGWGVGFRFVDVCARVCTPERARARKRGLLLNCSHAVLRPRRRLLEEVLEVGWS